MAGLTPLDRMDVADGMAVSISRFVDERSDTLSRKLTDNSAPGRSFASSGESFRRYLVCTDGEPYRLKVIP